MYEADSLADPLRVLTPPSTQGPTVAEKNAPSKITIASKAEPGERLIVSGVVFGADRKTPLANASVYIYHTDANGRYTPGATDDNRNPRLRGYLRTDAQGRYEYSTIKPAPYPGNGPPAHIHYHVNAPGYQQHALVSASPNARYLQQ